MSGSKSAAWANLAGKAVNRPDFAFVENDPALPDVLISGDSISIMYTERIPRKARWQTNVYRMHCNGRGLEFVHRQDEKDARGDEG